MKAFPSKLHHYDYNQHEVNKGMDLRDYFAAKAMQELLRAYHNQQISCNIAKESYEIADAMMEARK